VEIYRAHQLPTLVLAASIRSPRDIIAAAKAGADIATVPYKVLQQAAKHPLTEAGLAQFAADWQEFTSREAEASIATPV
jgi:transaldolase